MSASESKELEVLKAGLAELEASPDLADAVAAIAREAPRSRRPRRFPAWIVPAAAALIVVGALLLQSEDAGVPVGGPEEAKPSAQVFVPASPAEVAAARRANELPEVDARHTLRYGYRCEFDGDGMFEMWTDDHLAPIPKSRQRWVVDRKEGIPSKPKAYQYMSFPQEEGVLLLGPQMLVPDDAMVRGAGEKIEVHTKKGVWKPEPGTRYLELTLGSPEEGGTTARVRCVLSTAYTGTLLVPDPLARALALNHFELPGGFVAKLGGQEQPIRGQRALARVRIPELGIDRVVEVQARAPHHPRRLSLGPELDGVGVGTVTVDGAEPTRILHGGDATVPATGGANSLQQTIPEKGAHPIELRYDATADRPAARVVLGRYDFDEQTWFVQPFRATWVTLAQRDEPGARVTIAKVWRGTQAIPSLEGVVVTEVGKDGRIRFPRVAGEPASTLRMLVERKEGSAFHDVRIERPVREDEPGIEFRAGADGTVRFAASIWKAMDEPQKAVEGIADEIGEWVRESVKAGRAGGPQDGRVEIRAERDAPWQTVACILHAAAKAHVHEIRYHAVADEDGQGAGAAFIDNPLPTEGALMETPPETAATILLRRREDGTPHMGLRIRGGAPERLSVALPDVPDKNIRAAIRAALGKAVEGKRGQINLLPPRPNVPYYLVQIALAALHEAGATQVLFSSPMPAPIAKDR